MRSASSLRGAVVAVAMAVLMAGCGSSGSSTTDASSRKSAESAPSTAGRFLLVGVRNDTSSEVRFDQCKATCAMLHERRLIAPGGATTILGLDEGTSFAYLVATTSGRQLGCVYMKFDHVTARPTVLVSSMTACK